MEFKRSACVMAAMAVMVAGCGAPRPRTDASQVSSAAAQATQSAAGRWVIDPARSEIRLLVYRAGPMARLGHNHVIVNRAVRGAVVFSTGGDPVALSLTMPVESFIVDEARARDDEGVDFAEAVSDDAKAATRHNMLGASLLDEARFSDIVFDTVSVTRSAGVWSATLAVHIAGHDSRLTVPFVLNRLEHAWSASGSVRVQQSSLGLTPFSVMLGALQVRDELTVKFKLVAAAT